MAILILNMAAAGLGLRCLRRLRLNIIARVNMALYSSSVTTTSKMEPASAGIVDLA